MIDYERIALDALSSLDLPEGRRKAEFNNLVAVMQSDIAELRQAGISEDEVEQRQRDWVELHVKVLRMS